MRIRVGVSVSRGLEFRGLFSRTFSTVVFARQNFEIQEFARVSKHLYLYIAACFYVRHSSTGTNSSAALLTAQRNAWLVTKYPVMYMYIYCL
jgi:hypothetical protein